MTVDFRRDSLLQNPDVVNVVMQHLRIGSVPAVVDVLAPWPGIGLWRSIAEETYRLIGIGTALEPALVGIVHMLAIFNGSHGDRDIWRSRCIQSVLNRVESSEGAHHGSEQTECN